eukprot:9679-Heterococcus_DN1.PRE.2
MAAPDIAATVLEALSSSEDACIEDTWAFAESHGCDHVVVVGALKSLEADAMIVAEVKPSSFLELTAEGKEVSAKGSPEFQVYAAVPEGDAGATKAALERSLSAATVKIGMGACMRNGWLSKGADGALVRKTAVAADVTREKLQGITAASGAADSLTADELKDFKRRKLVVQVIRKAFKVTRGAEYALERQKKTADLTREMLETGEWKSAVFKEYNFSTLGAPSAGGYLHPLLKVRAEFRKVLMEMGFTEMPTNRWVESSFWNFDALFQPQFHPARDAHDTFFIKDPASALHVPEDYLQTVKSMHEEGGCGSIGYRYQWKRKEAVKNLLRTHTTAISTQMLYKLANQPGGFKPTRYFSIDRVFRNESMDATHLCEFHQVEGLIADRNLSLGDLIGTIKFFFEKIGITQSMTNA